MAEKYRNGIVLFCLGLIVQAQIFMMMGINFPTTLSPYISGRFCF
jgi:hypothetical protein